MKKNVYVARDYFWGGQEADGIGMGLSGADVGIDKALSALCDSDRCERLGSSFPKLLVG